jgi:hypothetical protein
MPQARAIGAFATNFTAFSRPRRGARASLPFAAESATMKAGRHVAEE